MKIKKVNVVRKAIKHWGYFPLLLLVGLLNSCSPTVKYEGYLFAYFTGNAPGEEAIRYAISDDGYNFRALNNNEPIIDSKDVSTSGGLRDPHILRGHDGKTFYMVATDLYVPQMGWQNYAMVLMKSTDLINWTSTVVNIPETFPEEFGDVMRVWAPQTIYDEEVGKYMLYFSMKQGDNPDIIYYAYANKDFTGLESTPKQLYFPPKESNTKACIDGDIIKKDGQFYLFHKAEDGDPGIKLAVSDKLTEGYKSVGSERVDMADCRVEGSGTFKLNNSDEWILMYDMYTTGKYQFTRSNDLENFTVVDEQISMNFKPRHGTIMPVTSEEMERLIAKYATYEDLLVSFDSPELRKQNIFVDTKKDEIYLPIKGNVNLAAFDPQITPFTKYIKVLPQGGQDFTKGAVSYTFSIAGKEDKTFNVVVSKDNNPVLSGFYADPDILYSEKTGKYYIYPTTDGIYNWGGYYFKTFSSENLVDWKDEGTILDLKKDVSWADRNAWAPCIVEKKINGEYKFFYYFTAAQKIGVAVADNPTGPFVDSGKPLINFKPKGVNGGQEIDPDVFIDPQTGKGYLYWGNGYLAAAELSEDMMSIKESTIKVMTPDETFREGAYVIYRKGLYYFMWSEDDTRSPNYKVRYATAKSPLGKLTIPENNIVIMKDEKNEIYGTGHNSAIQIPGKDEWYIVYHRFTRPKGIEMGRSAGFHREVCIDRLNFNEEGEILQTIPTVKGVQPLQ